MSRGLENTQYSITVDKELANVALQNVTQGAYTDSHPKKKSEKVIMFD